MNLEKNEFIPLLNSPPFFFNNLSTHQNDALTQELATETKKHKNHNMDIELQYKCILNAKMPPHNLIFNEEYFLKLLAGSISFLYEEKLSLIQRIPNLQQDIINNLIAVLEEEKETFADIYIIYCYNLISILNKSNNY